MRKPSAERWILLIALAAMATSALSSEQASNHAPDPRAAAAPAASPRGPGARSSATQPCLEDGSGYLRARLRGALEADIDWHNAELECDGGTRPDGHGIRMSFAGPLASRSGSARRLRFVFGVAAPAAGSAGRDLPANVTLILEGERRVFSTQGDDKCTVDELRQQPLDAAEGADVTGRRYRVVARGFCIGPASHLGGSQPGGGQHVLISRFDFAGRITIYPEQPEPSSHPAPEARRQSL